MIYEIPNMSGNIFWHKTRFTILDVETRVDYGWARYRVKIVKGNGRSKVGAEITFEYYYPHDFVVSKGNILNA